MKNYIATSIAVLAATSAMAQELQLPQAENSWYLDGQELLQQQLAQQPITTPARNVIVLIADGNGVGTNYATRLLAGQQAGGYGDDFVLPQELFPYLALVKTYNTNAQTPDSAGTATAIHSGIKTRQGVIGVDDTVARGDCSGVAAGSVATASEVFSERGMAIGVVSTARITHATPATAYAHAADRDFEDSSDLPEGCDVPDIATQLIDSMEAGTVDFAMGGGLRSFLDSADGGRRDDGVNLIERATGFGTLIARDQAEFDALALDGTPVLGLFENSHMQYEADRTDEPSLAEMTAAAITSLQTNEGGFFLTIEAGRVDHGNHAGNLYRAATDGIAFADAVAIADEMTKDSDTLIIVTADHEHAIAFNGYCGRGSSIVGLCYGVDPAGEAHNGEVQLGADGRPYTVAGYLNGEGAMFQEDLGWLGARPVELTEEMATDPDYQQQAMIPMGGETHSGEDVALYAKGPFAHLLDGTIEQNFIFNVMNYAVNPN